MEEIYDRRITVKFTDTATTNFHAWYEEQQ